MGLGERVDAAYETALGDKLMDEEKSNYELLLENAKTIESLRADILVDLKYDGLSYAPELVQSKYLQALALLEQAQHVMKEAALLTKQSN